MGFAMIATPLLALFVDYRSAMLLVAVPALLMAVAWLVANRRGIRGSGIPVSLLPAIVIGASFGVILQVGLSERTSLLLLASLLTITLLTPRILTALRTTTVSSRSSAAIFGGLAGITESALNVGAPFLLLFGALARLGRIQQLMALNLCFMLGKTIQIGLMHMSGPPPLSFTAVAMGTVASSASYFVGDRVARRFSEGRFRALLQYFLLIMVGTLVLRAVLI